MTEHMQAVWAWLEARYRAEDGATAIEYGLLAALISVVIIAAVKVIGVNLTSTFTKVGDALK